MKTCKNRYFRLILPVVLSWIVIVLLSSSITVRSFLAAPLRVHEEKAYGDACYVLAGGGSIWERLDAAADLYHLDRVSRILLMRDDLQSQYSFKSKTSLTRTQWMLDYLNWRGVPAVKASFIGQSDGVWGTLNEARAVARMLPREIKTLVVVSSAPHMRRTVLAFRRSLPADVKVIPFAATSFETSYEMTFPIWVEYMKLMAYYVIA